MNLATFKEEVATFPISVAQRSMIAQLLAEVELSRKFIGGINEASCDYKHWGAYKTFRHAMAIDAGETL